HARVRLHAGERGLERCLADSESPRLGPDALDEGRKPGLGMRGKRQRGGGDYQRAAVQHGAHVPHRAPRCKMGGPRGSRSQPARKPAPAHTAWISRNSIMAVCCGSLNMNVLHSRWLMSMPRWSDST